MNDLYIITPTNSDLQHHGILGMHWGRRNGPPYPLGSSDHSASEKKAGWRKSLSSGKGLFGKRKKAKADRIAKANAKKVVEERLKQKEADEFFEKNKEKILRSNKAKDVLANQARLTTQELNDAVYRMDLNERISRHAMNQTASAWKKMDSMMRGPVKDMVDWTDIGIRAWNDMAKIYNTTSAGKQEKLPLIGQGGGDQKK